MPPAQPSGSQELYRFEIAPHRLNYKIGLAPVMPEASPRPRGDARGRPRNQALHLRLDLVTIENIVGIEELDKVPTRSLQPDIARRACPFMPAFQDNN